MLEPRKAFVAIDIKRDPEPLNVPGRVLAQRVFKEKGLKMKNGASFTSPRIF